MDRPTGSSGPGNSSAANLAASLATQAGLEIRNLGRMNYNNALAEQHAEHARILAARDATPPSPRGVILVVEHEPVITVSQRESATSNLLASREHLAALGVDVQPTDRGGDITYHGPGQIVLYPIIDLNAFHLRLHDYMRLLEQAVIDTLAEFNIPADREPGNTGVWVPHEGRAPAKVAAMGVRVRRWITLHGLALNVRVNLSHFNLIVPCGLIGREVTSLHTLLPEAPPSFERVADVLTANLAAALADHRTSPQPPGTPQTASDDADEAITR